MSLMQHQIDALNKLENGKILVGGVGTGKSRVAVHYYLGREADKDVYVITTAKKRDTLDWQSEFAQQRVGKTPDSTVAGVLTIDSWNRIHEYVDVKGAFFVFDEQRLVGSGKWVKSFLKIAEHNNWIVLTATPGDTWLDYIGVMVANGFYKNRTEFKREHVVYNPYVKFPKVSRYVAVGKLLRLRNQILVEMPYDKHTTRHLTDVECDYDKELYDKVWRDRWNPFLDQPVKNAGELFLVLRKVVNSDQSRLESVRGLLQDHPKLIIFYNFNYELEALRELDEVALGEWNGHLHQDIPKASHWAYLVQYTAGAEGWNCIETDAMVFYSQTYSYKIFEQSQGRIDRLNTPYYDLYYYLLKSKAPIDLGISKAVKQKRNFNEKEYNPLLSCQDQI